MFRPQLHTNTPTRAGSPRRPPPAGYTLSWVKVPRAAARILDAGARRGAAFHDRLGDVLGAVEGAAGVNALPERGGGLKAAGLHKVIGAQRDLQSLGQGHHIRRNHHAHRQDDHIKDFVLDLARFGDVADLQVAVFAHRGDACAPGSGSGGPPGP